MLFGWQWNYVCNRCCTITSVAPTEFRFMAALHKAWPELHKRMMDPKSGENPEDGKLVVASRTWFCLYLFEHQ
jgi:hypothetical protein